MSKYYTLFRRSLASRTDKRLATCSKEPKLSGNQDYCRKYELDAEALRYVAAKGHQKVSFIRIRCSLANEAPDKNTVWSDFKMKKLTQTAYRARYLVFHLEWTWHTGEWAARSPLSYEYSTSTAAGEKDSAEATSKNSEFAAQAKEPMRQW